MQPHKCRRSTVAKQQQKSGASGENQCATTQIHWVWPSSEPASGPEPADFMRDRLGPEAHNLAAENVHETQVTGTLRNA